MNLIKLALTAEKLALTKDRPPVSVIENRCLRERDKSVPCDICATGCPTEAITLHGTVAVDVERCIRCGSCLHACPVGAFEGVDGIYSVLRCATQIVDKERLEIACAHHPEPERGPRGVDGVICTQGCLSSLSASAYISLLALGIDRVDVRLDACENCPIGELKPRIIERIERAQSLLDQQGMGERLGTAEVGKARRPVYSAKNPPVSRRGLLGMGRKSLKAEDILPRGAPQIEGEGSAPRDRRRLINALSYLRDIDMDAHLPDGTGFTGLAASESCTACGLCARLCPTGALAFDQNEGEQTFAVRFSAAACTDCDLCTRFCEPKALIKNGPPTYAEILDPEPITLIQGTYKHCKKCHTAFHGLDEYCPTCAFRKANPFGYHIPDAVKAVLEQRQKDNKQ